MTLKTSGSPGARVGVVGGGDDDVPGLCTHVACYGKRSLNIDVACSGLLSPRECFEKPL